MTAKVYNLASARQRKRQALEDAIIERAAHLIPNERIRRTATANGCKPRWHAPWACYTCTCPGNTHGCDSQCSAIDEAGAKRRAK